MPEAAQLITQVQALPARALRDGLSAPLAEDEPKYLPIVDPATKNLQGTHRKMIAMSIQEVPSSCGGSMRAEPTQISNGTKPAAVQKPPAAAKP